MKAIAVAKMLGISREHLSRVENGRRGMSEELKEKAQKLFGQEKEENDSNGEVFY